MADLASLRLAVGHSRRQLEQTRRALHDDAARVADMQRQLALFGGPPPDQPDFGEILDSLTEHVEFERRMVTEMTDAHQAARAAYDAAAHADAALWTGDDLPLLLLPVRLEAVYQVTGGATQLLLRVYPDDVHVDAHEEELTDTEREAGRLYHEAVSNAAGDPAATGEAWEELVSRLGGARAAWALEATRPGAAPVGRRERPWTRAAHTQLLPDRFVFTAYTQRAEEAEGEYDVAWRKVGRPIPDTLAVGFPPREADAEEADRVGRLPWDRASRWLVDFDEAIEVGMGLKVALPEPDLRYPLLTVVGVMADLDGAGAAARVQTALQAHQYGQGLAFLPAGTPTNNTPATRSAWRSRPAPRPPGQVEAQRAALDPDGAQAAARLARAFGIDGRQVLAAAPDALDEGEDVDLRRLHRAFGLLYAQSPLLRPYPPLPANPDELVVDDTVLIPDLPELVAHFSEHVRSRGTLPTLRVGRQPYGVLATTSLDLWRGPAPVPALLDHLMSLVSTVEGMLDLVPQTGRGDDPDRVILDLLSRVPASQRLRQTQTRPVELNQSLVRRPPPAVFGTVPVGTRVEFFGLPDGQVPPRDLLGPPDEETSQVVAARPLARVFQVAVDRMAAFAADPGMDPAPFDARHDEAWGQLMLPLVDVPIPRTFHAIAGQVLGQLNLFVRTVEQLTTLPEQFTPQDHLFYPDALARQREVAEAFVALEDRAVADLPGLDRLLLEVLDTLSHRIDAWVTSFAAARLGEVRSRRPDGVHVGAYGWLTDLHDTGPMPAGDGYVMTPSIHHAATAAVLRSGFLAHADPSAFAVDLQSWRVRAALDLVDGVRGGQPLGVLLGYRFERGLHDAGLDALIEPFRLAFPLPLAVDQTVPEGPAASRTAIEARSVVDGQRLRRGDIVPAAGDPRSQPDGVQQVIDRLIADLDEVVDAVADLLLAESVHHLVGGNPLRAGLSADAIGHGEGLPEEYDVIRTPRSAAGITHHLGVLAPDQAPPGWATDRPLARLEPAIDAWLTGLLGDPAGWLFPRAGAPALSLASLGWCGYDVVLGASRPARHSALGAALRAAAADQPLDETGWARAEELAALAELLRETLAGASPLLPTHLDPAAADPWASADVDDLRARVDAWLQVLRTGREQLAVAVTAASPPDVAAALADLAAAGVRVPNPAGPSDDGLPDGEPPDPIVAGIEALGRLGPEQVAALSEPAASAGAEERTRQAMARVSAVLGEAMTLAPALQVTGPDPAAAPAGASSDQVEDWLRGIVPVRRAAAALSDALAASTVLAGAAPGSFLVVQQPGQPGQSWVATSAPAADGARPVRFTTVLHTDGRAPGAQVRGLVLDSWMEAVPRAGGEHGPSEIAGVAFHHDRPGARAPQALLVALAPDPERGWCAEDVHAVVEDTLRSAVVRSFDLRDAADAASGETPREPDLRRLLPIPGPF